MSTLRTKDMPRIKKELLTTSARLVPLTVCPKTDLMNN